MDITNTKYGRFKNDGILAMIENHLVQVLEMLNQKTGCEDARQKLEEMKKLVASIEPYTIERSTPLSPNLDKILEETSILNLSKLSKEGKFIMNIDNTDLKMISFPGQVQLLQFFVRKLKAKNILEIGSFTGLAAFGMAEVTAPDGKVTGIELEPFFCDLINRKTRECNLNVEVKQGKAIDILKSMAKEGQQYDLIYIDCVKVEYQEYYKIIMENSMLLPNGLIVCDNLLWSGGSITRSDRNGSTLDDFGRAVSQDKRVISVMLPCYDGTLLIQHRYDKKD